MQSCRGLCIIEEKSSCNDNGMVLDSFGCGGSGRSGLLSIRLNVMARFIKMGYSY